MKQNPTLKSLVLAAACALALAASARADDSVIAPAEPAPVAANLSLLGLTHGTLTYSRVNFDDLPVDGDRFAFEVNQAVADGFDARLTYDYLRTGDFAGGHLSQHTLVAGLRAFSSSFHWGRPYVEAGIGHAWNRFAGTRDNSLVWEFGGGAEFQVAPRATVTPYVKYRDLPDVAGSEGTWNFGVKGSYWVDARWAVTAGLERDDEQNMTFSVGTNFRY